MRLSQRKLIFRALFLFVIAAGCASPTAGLPNPAALAQPTPTLIDIPTRPPTYTAAVFERKPTSTPIPTETRILQQLTPVYSYGADGFPLDVNPLTGLQVSDPSLLERRPLVIKVTNFPRSVRPQWGLTLADHVFEYYLEDELTRFIAVFYGNDAERVGPVRSGRPFDEYVVRAYKGVFAFAYADDRLIDFWKGTDMAQFEVIEKPDNCPPMCRIGPENDYNTLYTNTSQLTDYVASRAFSHGRQDLTGLRFALNTAKKIGNDGEADRLEIRYSPSSYNYWEYDPATFRYYRWEDTDRRAVGEEDYAPLFDSLTAQQVYADNLIVLLVPTVYFYKSNSTKVYDIQLIGEGEAFALQQGKVYAIRWSRPEKGSMLRLSFPNGAPYPLKPGNTFFEVLTAVTPHVISGSTWRFEFNLPEDLPVPTPTPKGGASGRQGSS